MGVDTGTIPGDGGWRYRYYSRGWGGGYRYFPGDGKMDGIQVQFLGMVGWGDTGTIPGDGWGWGDTDNIPGDSGRDTGSLPGRGDIGSIPEDWKGDTGTIPGDGGYRYYSRGW